MIGDRLYKDTLTHFIKMCNDIDNSIFIGQQIVWRGNPMSTTLDFDLTTPGTFSIMTLFAPRAMAIAGTCK
jgi:hypothetical protein